ncbi:MAG: CoA transferase [Pseudonocardiales bacterium]|nr:CoA transferase [Pseudonocardiales bacterium]
MTAPLHDLRIVDLTTGISGAVATLFFADFGGSVVKVEPPGGDPTRAEPGFAMWARGKRSLQLDLSATGDRDALAELLRDADVCVTNDDGSDPQSPIALSLSAAANTRLIVLEMPAYVGPAPWAGNVESNELLSASMGVSLRQSSFEDAPVDPVSKHLLYEQGIWAGACAIAALVERESSGAGQRVLVSGAHGSAVAGSATLVVDPANTATAPPPGPGGPNQFYTRYQCSDGLWLFLGSLTPKFQYRAMAGLGLKAMLDDPRLAGGLEKPLDNDVKAWLRAEMTATFASDTREHWLEQLRIADCPAGPLLSREDWLDHPQIRAIGMRQTVTDPERGEVVMPGMPLVMTASPAIPAVPAPTLGEAAGFAWPEREDSPAPAGDPAGNTAGPLAGIRIIDLGTILAGPFAGSLLAELGADVLKVEPLEGDSFRVTGFIYNRGMRSIAMDLRNPAGREAFYDLVRGADVVIDNYRGGVLERLRIDYDSLVAINPEVISLSITGYGEGGPLSAEPGFDPILQGMSGMMSAQGGDSEPYFLTLAINDATAGALSVLGTALALYHRLRTGDGQRVWTSLAGVSAFMQSGELTRFAGRPAAKFGGRDYPGPSALDRLYRASDGWVRLQAGADQIGALADAGLLAGDAARSEDELLTELTASFAACERDSAVGRLTALGVPAASVRKIAELPSDGALMDRELMQVQRFSGGAPYYAPGRVAGFDRTQQTATLIAPGLSEHAREILSEAGYDDAAIDRLVAEKAIIEGGPLEIAALVSYR